MASAIGLTETGPQMDWTRDAKIYDRYLNWKTSGIDLQLSSIQGHCSPEVELPTTVHGWPRYPPHQEVGEHSANVLWKCQSCRRSWNIQWLQIGNLLEATRWGAETQREQTTFSDWTLDSEQARVKITQWMVNPCTQPCRVMWLPHSLQGKDHPRCSNHQLLQWKG